MEANKIRCERCGEILTKVKWLELSQTDGYYYETIPEGHVSQGAFSFGIACARIELIRKSDPRDNPLTDDDSWIHDVDMGAR